MHRNNPPPSTGETQTSAAATSANTAKPAAATPAKPAVSSKPTDKAAVTTQDNNTVTNTIAQIQNNTIPVVLAPALTPTVSTPQTAEESQGGAGGGSSTPASVLLALQSSAMLSNSNATTVSNTNQTANTRDGSSTLVQSSSALLGGAASVAAQTIGQGMSNGQQNGGQNQQNGGQNQQNAAQNQQSVGTQLTNVLMSLNNTQNATGINPASSSFAQQIVQAINGHDVSSAPLGGLPALSLGAQQLATVIDPSLSASVQAASAASVSAASASTATTNTTAAVVNLPIDTPLGSPDWTQSLSHNVTLMMSNKLESAQMQLNPPNLGPIEVTLKMGADRLATIDFVTNSSHARAALEGNIDKLAGLLSNNGIQLGSANISGGDAQRQAFNFMSSQQQHQQQAEQHQQQQQQADTPAFSLDMAAADDVTRVSISVPSSITQPGSERGGVNFFA